MKNYIIVIIIITLITLVSSAPAEPKEKLLDFEYIGLAVQTEGMHVWGSSPIIGPDGEVHLYVARWPMHTQTDFSGWYKDCEIAHYKGKTPEGPFEFVRIAVPDKDGIFNSPHNPTIKYIDGKYVLCFIVNENSSITTQRIIMYVAEDLDDNWRPAASAEKDGTILRKPSDPNIWNHRAEFGVSNPTLVKFKKKYFLFHKSVVKVDGKKSWIYGVAISDKLEGPYKHQPNMVTASTMELEDAYALTMGDSVYLISRDFRGSKGSYGGGLLWKSSDGLYFDVKDTTRCYEDLSHYLGKKALSKANKYRGNRDGHLERAQVLSIDGKPAYLYVATGINTTDGYGSCSHVFKIKTDLPD